MAGGDGRVAGVVSATALAHKAEFKALGGTDGYTPPMRARLRGYLAHDHAPGQRKATGLRAVGRIDGVVDVRDELTWRTGDGIASARRGAAW